MTDPAAKFATPPVAPDDGRCRTTALRHESAARSATDSESDAGRVKPPRFLMRKLLLRHRVVFRPRYASSMAEFDRTKDFIQLADALEREFTARNMHLKSGGAKELLRAHLDGVANQLGISKRSALNYLSIETAVELARSAARSMRETEANDDALPPIPLGTSDAGLMISTFAVAARIGAVNGDPDVTADLCEVITGISMALRTQDLPAVPALLIRNGIRWASLSADRLADGAWAVMPGKRQPDTDQGVATQLRADLDAIASLTEPDA
jgi:hypothetical protein